MGRNIWIGVVVVIVLVAEGWWYLNQSSTPTTSETTQQNTNTAAQPLVNNQPPQSAQANPTPSTPSGTKTYSNSQYGFSIQYPSTVQVNPPCTEDRQTQYLCSPTTLISFHEAAPQGSSWFRDGYVAIYASTDAQVVASCTSASPIGKTSTVAINGIQFTLNGEGDAAAGTEHSSNVYNVFKNGVCYGIIDDEWSYVDETGKYTTSQTQVDLHSIVQSFRFN